MKLTREGEEQQIPSEYKRKEGWKLANTEQTNDHQHFTSLTFLKNSSLHCCLFDADQLKYRHVPFVSSALGFRGRVHSQPIKGEQSIGGEDICRRNNDLAGRFSSERGFLSILSQPFAKSARVDWIRPPTNNTSYF